MYEKEDGFQDSAYSPFSYGKIRLFFAIILSALCLSIDWEVKPGVTCAPSSEDSLVSELDLDLTDCKAACISQATCAGAAMRGNVPKCLLLGGNCTEDGLPFHKLNSKFLDFSFYLYLSSLINTTANTFSLGDHSSLFLPKSCLLNTQVGRKKRSPETNKPPIDIYINKDRKQELEDIEKVIIDPVLKYFEELDMSAVYPDLFQLLWHSQLPCFKGNDSSDGGLLAHCEVAGEEVDCKGIFKTVATDEGLCCAFNSRDVLKKSGYKDLILKMRGESTNNYNSKLVPKAGKKNGLKIILDAHYDKVTFGSVYGDASGMRVFIGEPEEFVVMGERGKVLEPGKEHFLDISGYVIKADTKLTKLSPKNRRCFFKDESSLEYHEVYTATTCKLECGIQAVEKEMQCVPWYLPQGRVWIFSWIKATFCGLGNDSIVCDPWKAETFREKLGVFDPSSCQCFSLCSETRYRADLTSAAFRFVVIYDTMIQMIQIYCYQEM